MLHTACGLGAASASDTAAQANQHTSTNRATTWPSLDKPQQNRHQRQAAADKKHHSTGLRSQRAPGSYRFVLQVHQVGACVAAAVHQATVVCRSLAPLGCACADYLVLIGCSASRTATFNTCGAWVRLPGAMDQISRSRSGADNRKSKGRRGGVCKTATVWIQAFGVDTETSISHAQI